MNHESAGKVLMVFGGIAATIGALIYFFGPKFDWIGRLPGDIRYQSEQVQFYFPLTTLLLINALIWIGLRVWAWIKG